LTESGLAYGTSNRYDGSTYRGASAWVYDSSVGTSTRIGLFGPDYTYEGGTQVSSVEMLGSNGLTVGYSRYQVVDEDGTRHTPQAAWIHDQSIGETRAIGLSYPGAETPWITQNAFVIAMTDSGYVFGHTGAPDLQAAWVYDHASGETTRVGLYDAPEHVNADGQWHHVAVTFNSPQDQEVYVDGVRDTAASPTYIGQTDSGGVFRLGWAETSQGGGYQEYVGLMDDVYLYDRSLGAGELAELYEYSRTVLVLENTNLAVTGISTLHLDAPLGEAAFGNLTLDPGVALRITGATARFHDVAAGHGASIQGDLSVAGTLSPSDSPGTLNVGGGLTMEATSTYHWQLGAVAADVVAVDGDLGLIDGWTLRLADAGGTAAVSDEIDLFTYTGSLSFGTCLIDASQVADSGRWDWSAATIRYDQNRVYLTGLTVVPEPGTLLMLLSGATALLSMLRRRRHQGSSRPLPL
jgi:hypothetical protein